MKLAAYLLLSHSIAITAAFDCNKSAFSAILPANASILYAVQIPANGSFGGGPTDLEFPTNVTNLPALCAIAVNVVSSSTSSFNFGLFLTTEWNSRFIVGGNGGFGGGINWPDMGQFSHYGFAAMSTDTGHLSTAFDGSWALNHPETIIDWGYRAMHDSVLLSKTIITAYYGLAPRYSYYSSCSTGGRQGLKEVQMFPDDFDGVIAGAPAWWTTHLQTWSAKIGIYNLPSNASSHIPASLFPAIVDEIVRQCDPQDGVVDGIIMDPYGCNFYPEALLCTPGSNSSDCLTAPQLDTVYHIYNDWVETNQTFVFPHLALGADPTILAGVTDTPSPLGTEYIENFIVNDTNWDWRTFGYDLVQLADRLDPGNATADDFDLSTFERHGGKLLQYHGLADPLIPTGSSTYYYKHVLRNMEPKGVVLDDFYRLFLVPGMGHCMGSANAPWYFAAGGQTVTGISYSVPGFMDAEHDIILAMMDWVEKGEAPQQIIATKFVNDTLNQGIQSQRPLCVFPKQAKFTGGDVDKANSWQCK